ncbi:aldehyde dehydrogenase domain-containing protein [Halenospora varia]|nr:aldehyde dehydrogenase domain-containing protein [Halenospora varia]
MATIVPLIINGEEVRPVTRFQVISPNTSTSIWESSSASQGDAIAAVEAAAHAFSSWSKSRVEDRRQIILKAADILEARSNECRSYMEEETGAQEKFSGFNIKVSADLLREIGGGIGAALAGIIPICQEEGTHALVVKEPYGVCLGIAPWNAPYILGFRSVAYALAAGNTCILKGSETSPRCHWAIGSIFKEAGLPNGVLNVIFHRPQDAAEITNVLIEHPAVRKINFTGSTAVGSIIASAAGKNLKPVLMELGGKSSAIVCEDANIPKAAIQCALGAFLHSGQICMSTERILVHKSILDSFCQELSKAVSNIFESDPSAPAPAIAQAPGVEKNRKLISDAVSKGAKLVYGDLNTTEISKYRMRPVIVGGVTKEMNLYNTESFGPSVSLIAVESDEQAIEVANDTEYGLSGAVFTENLARGLYIAGRIESGAIHINSMSVHDEARLPHGGTKRSGWGRFNGQWGLDEFLKTKTITFQGYST